MSKFGSLAVAVDDVRRLTLVGLNGQPLRNEAGEEAWIDLLSAASPIGRAHDRAMIDKAIKRGTRRASAEELEADDIEKLAKLTKGWKLIGPDGQNIDVECSLSDARDFYSMPECSWVTDQVRAFVSDLGNFRKDASTS